jgi:hypothetical protein
MTKERATVHRDWFLDRGIFQILSHDALPKERATLPFVIPSEARDLQFRGPFVEMFSDRSYAL